MDLLLAGVAHCGHFERFLGRVRPPLRAVLGNGFEECFTLSRDAFRKFPFLRWKLLLRLFSHRWVYQLLGNRDPAFVAADARPILIARALQMTLEEDRVPDSFMFHLIFKGDLDAMSPERLPPSLRKEVLAAVRTKLHEPGFVIRFHEGDLRTVVGRWPQRDFSLTFFSVSDILSFTDFDYLLNFLQLLRGRHTSVVFRSFLRHGLTRDQLQTLRARFTEVEDVSHEEKTCLYRVYHVRV